MNSDFTTILGNGINSIITELQQYENETDIWNIEGEIKNSAGNLAFHLTGSINYFIGAVMANNGYVRNRDAEFSDKNISREKMISELNTTKTMMEEFISKQDVDFYNAIFPLQTFGENRSNHYALMIIAVHLNYHLGQINYHRRLIGK
ncbi:MAG: DUF1572 family protein [Chitinophagales bacterium]|nr:DUF1572 family protein [Bacteroidota bacterium]MBP7398027.1 DUF1572 family protein [Chitinophagales bacterium]MBK8489142.1 DUF1572 family protein [Bacteroidota bacterium]MBP8753621.1 DUF1572 family protein [Chitinophagales bacterium]MBP9188368.1 DUF1572 family protein [Chitinophagales bacterium]